MKFGPRLKELRSDKKMTQEDLGKLLGVTKASISGYENETRQPDNESLGKLADIFDVTVDYLLGRTDDKHEEVLAAAHLNKDLEDMTPEQRQAVYDFIEFQKRRIDKEIEEKNNKE